MSTKTTADRERIAAQSAGRAAGYCWIRDPQTGLHCTRPPGHAPGHRHYYARVDFN